MNIIELAEKAGLKVGTNISGVTLVGSPSTPGLAHISIYEMERFAALVLEEAAKVCDDIAADLLAWKDRDGAETAISVRDAIRTLKGAKE